MRLAFVLLMFASPALADDACKPKLAGKVRLTFKPDHSVAELATWLTSMTCKSVKIAKDVPANALKVTILAPKEYTPRQAIRLVTTAIAATGAAVQEKPFAFEITRGPDLPKDCADAAPVGTATPEPPEVTDGIGKTDDTHYKIKRALADKLVADPDAYSKGARLVPAMKNGVIEGLKIYAIRPSSVFGKLGLLNGDTIRAVDKLAITDKVALADVIAHLKNKTTIKLELVRRGADVTIVYTIE